MMDSRAGSIVGTGGRGADLTIQRDASGRQRTSTTTRDMRGREEDIVTLAEIRSARNAVRTNRYTDTRCDRKNRLKMVSWLGLEPRTY